jgi:hypothetical protein
LDMYLLHNQQLISKWCIMDPPVPLPHQQLALYER